jgi:hypothetical protein
MGIDFGLRVLTKTIVFGLIIAAVHLFLGKLFDYAGSFVIETTAFQIASYLGIFQSLALFIDIIVVGFVVKFGLRYWSNI